MQSLPYLLALHSIKGLGPIRLKLLIDYFKDPKIAWEADKRKLEEIRLPKNAVLGIVEARKKLDPLTYAEQIFKSGIKVLTYFDDSYPKLLGQIYDPPMVIFYKGEISLAKRIIAIVGTRKMSGYGKLVTEKFAKELTQAGFVIVSGLARGVDTQAHEACLQAGGKTWAVLGGGIKKIFPPENTSLAEKIASGSGAVISEFCPDEPSLPGNFPARNRIIAGLSLGVLVTEAAEDSGSLITARLALEEGREVFAVPGPITSTLSAGTAQLIKQGARVVTSVEDILESLGIERKNVITPEVKGDQITEVEKQILSCLENEGKHIDQIVRETKKTSAEVSASLVKMEIMGFVKSLGGGNYTKSI